MVQLQVAAPRSRCLVAQRCETMRLPLQQARLLQLEYPMRHQTSCCRLGCQKTAILPQAVQRFHRPKNQVRLPRKKLKVRAHVRGRQANEQQTLAANWTHQQALPQDQGQSLPVQALVARWGQRLVLARQIQAGALQTRHFGVALVRAQAHQTSRHFLHQTVMTKQSLAPPMTAQQLQGQARQL